MWANNANSSNIENLEVEFSYADTDSHANEMAELYAYSEEQDILNNRTAYEEVIHVKERFADMSPASRRRVLEVLLNGFEISEDVLRWKHIQGMFYILQGCFGECDTLDQQLKNSRDNVFEVYQLGLFTILVQVLVWEVELTVKQDKKTSCLADSFKLRTILGMLYTIVEIMRCEDEDEMTQEEKSFRRHLTEELKQELNQPKLLAIILLEMVTRFANNSCPVIPIRKTLLLLWKVLLVSLGGTDELKDLKRLYRQEAGLLHETEDTLQVVKSMRAASPPAVEGEAQRKTNKPLKRQMLVKQSSVGEVAETTVLEEETTTDEETECRADSLEEVSDLGGRPASPETASLSLSHDSRLPWTPKVSNKDIDSFLDYSRNKFIGFLLKDRTTTAGLPQPILESLKVLHKHVYVSLSEVQVLREEELTQYPLTKKETLPNNSIERLYSAMLPSLSQYMISLLKVLLAAAPTSRAKSSSELSLNIVSDVLPLHSDCIVHAMKVGIDVNRHKEVVIKSISATLLLLLKHCKTNHVYQFEYICQQLMFANCIPLVLKFLNQNVCQFVYCRNTVAVIDFPACVVGEQPELTAEHLDVGQVSHWRNMFSCINLLRILNKLTKGKHSRIMMLVVFKSAPILKRALKLRHAMLQLYILKLLKMQAKYLGRQWRKTNMKTMSAIYQKVRHRLTDDWAFGNDMDSRPWDFQAEEFALQANINRFHDRRYRSVDNNNIQDSYWSLLDKEVVLPTTFKQNYEEWLQREVFDRQTDWDLLLTETNSSQVM